MANGRPFITEISRKAIVYMSKLYEYVPKGKVLILTSN